MLVCFICNYNDLAYLYTNYFAQFSNQSLDGFLSIEKGRPMKIEDIKNPGEYLEADIKYITRTIFSATGELYYKIGCEFI